MLAIIGIVLIAILASSVQGLLQASVSVNINSNIDVKSTGWHKIQTWQKPVETGHVIIGTTVTNGDVSVPYSGIYLAFVTVTLNGADGGGRFKLRLIINDKLNNSHSGMTSSFLGGPLGPRSISVKGALLLQSNDFVSIYVHSETDADWSISGQSQTAFSLQYINDVGNAPGFSAIFQTETFYNNSNWNHLREWRHDSQPGLFKSMTGFSKHVGEFVALCNGIYIITANAQIKTNGTSYFTMGIGINSVVTGSTIKSIASKEFTLSLSTSVKLNKGDVISLQVHSFGQPFVVGSESSFTAVRIRSHSTVALGFSTVLEHDVLGSGGDWVQIPLHLPNGTSYGQFKDNAQNSIASGRYFSLKDGIFIVSASIRVVAESLISATLFTRIVSASSISGNIVGIYSGLTKLDYQNEVTFSTAGTIQLSKSYPLSFYFYMQNAGKYRILSGSRISVVLAEVKYPAFHATLDTNVPQSSENAWIEVTSWKTDKATGSISLTDSISSSTGRYTADVSGIYLVSSNIIFNAAATVISMLISVNGGQSKRSALFSTKGNPANKDTLSTSGALRLTKGEFISVWAKVTGTPSWSVGYRSSFSVTLLGLPFSVPGFSTVFSSTQTFTRDGWNQLTGLSTVSASGPFFHYGGGLDVTYGKYQAPVAGMYMVSANLKLKQATRPNAEFIANIAIDNNPGSTTYLNGINDYVLRSVSLGSEDFYSMNVAGVIKLIANQNVTLWIKSTAAGTWQLSEDSSFSIVLIHQENDLHASGFQAVLSPSISQTVVGATSWKIVRYWQTTRENSQKGLFKQEKYQYIDASSGTVTVKESGLYYITALVTLKDAIGKFEVGIHVQSQLAGLFSTVDSSKLNRYTVKMFGLLYIPETHTMTVMVRAPVKKNWEQDMLYCGLSFVKISPLVVPPTLASSTFIDSTIPIHSGLWTRITNWVFSDNSGQYLIGNGFSKKTGVFTATRNGIYIVSGLLDVETINLLTSIEMKIALNSNTSNVSTSDSGNGITTLKSRCNQTCILYASGVIALKSQETVSILVQTNGVNQLMIKKASSFSLLLISESLPLPNGMHGMLSSSLLVNVKGNKQLTGWQILPSTGGFFGSTGDMNSFPIKSTGIFFVSINIKFKNLLGIAKAFASIVNIPAITSVIESKSDSTFVLSVSGCMKMAAGSFYTVTVYSETDTNFEILAGSSKSAVFLGSNVEGFTATQSRTTTLSLKPNSVNHITGWSTSGKDWLYESGPGFADRRSYIVQTTGIYYVVSHVIISGSFNSTGVYVTLAVERDGFVKPENGLYAKHLIKGRTTQTLVIAGNVYLAKLTQLKLVVMVSQALNVEMNIDSTFSIVKTSKDLSVQKCTDDGPKIIGKLTPDVVRSSYKRPVSWQCAAIGQSVTYSWMKDFQPIPGVTSSSFQIASTQVSDTGEYVCVATANGVRTTSNIAKLTIYDPLPEFLNPVQDFNLSVPENGPSVLGILFIQARARSFSNNFARMSFEIISGNLNNTFDLSPKISDNGVNLMRQQKLDREKRDNYTIVITATNLDAYSVAIQRINITVTDVNDNKPLFTQAVYRTSIYENTTAGTTVTRVQATDMDIGMNAVIKYWFIPSSGGNVFAVDQNTGYVTLQGQVDRESRDLYVIFVTASDGMFTSYAELSIRILDLNEHAPVFNPLHYVSRISETLLPGSTVATVTASDNDTGINADLTYDIIGGDPDKIFRITKYGVIQNQKTLNYEANTTYLLTVSVRDNGQPRLHANKTAIVQIYVSDANDNSPRFSQSSYEVNLFENVTQGIVILEVRATDDDAKGQPESTLIYALEGTNEELQMFLINSTTGDITLNTTLDYERIKSYRLTAIAKDAGVPSLKDKAQISINVLDVNDNRPYFLQSRVVLNVTESSQINRDIYKVTATDKDSKLNADLRYHLLSGNVDNTFTIDPVYGNVIAVNPLDHERNSHYELKISCRDLGNPQLTCQSSFTLSINVQDENDNSPAFDSEKYSTDVPENTAIGSVILKINVSDPDSGPNGNFSITMKGDSARSVFKYDRNEGALILIGSLDFEKKSHYQFSVVAKDFGTPPLEKSASVEIHVTDVNDNIPTFSQSQYDSQVPEKVFANVTIFQMIAKDPDIGPGRRLTYEIVSGDDKGQFKIGKYDGIVETVTFLDTESVTTFKLEIIAKDSFTPPAVSNRTLLNIHVTKTPNVAMTDIKAGTTSLEVTFDVSEFYYLKIVQYEVLVQEYLPEDPNFNMAAVLTRITWYGVNIKPTKPTSLDRLRRYVAMTINVPATKRRRRSIKDLMKNIVIGNETGCEKKTGPNDVCNGPLHANKQYRLQIRGYVQNSKFPRDSHFSVPIQLGKPAASTANLVDSSVKDGAIGLAVAFCACTILTIIFFIAYVQYKRKHQITSIEHVNDNMIQEGTIFMEPLTQRTGFDSLSDIGLWPKISMASESQLMQRSRGGKESFLQIPRSPGDSGINQANDDDDSWKMSDDEGWDNVNSRRGNVRLTSSMPVNDLRRQARALRGISDSNTSLDTNGDNYHTSAFSENLRNIFNNDGSNKPRVEVQTTKDEDDNEIETEFGPELETSFGADADLSSIDEENFEDE